MLKGIMEVGRGVLQGVPGGQIALQGNDLSMGEFALRKKGHAVKHTSCLLCRTPAYHSHPLLPSAGQPLLCQNERLQPTC